MLESFLHLQLQITHVKKDKTSISIADAVFSSKSVRTDEQTSQPHAGCRYTDTQFWWCRTFNRGVVETLYAVHQSLRSAGVLTAG